MGGGAEHREELVEKAARGQSGVLSDWFQFLRETKKWWLAPILVCMLLFGVLVFLSGTAAAPFIYTLF